MKNWDDLRIFQALAGARSIREAAALIGTTHATVSRRIRALEEELGSTLFERARNGISLTVFGQGVLTFAENASENVAAVDRLAFSKEGSLAGPVRLSLLEDLYSFVLAEPIDAFMIRHPMIELIVDTSASLSDLGRREADVIVRITRSPPEQAFGRKVADSPLAAYASQSYLDNRPKIDRWIALDYPPTISPLLQAHPAFMANSLSVVAKTLQLGQGVGLLPCFIGENFPELVRLSEVALIPDMEIWVLTHEDVRYNPRVRALMDYLYQAFSTHRSLIEGVG